MAIHGQAPYERMLGTRADILGCPIDALDMDETVAQCERQLERGVFTHQVSINAAKLMAYRSDGRLRTIVDAAELVSADGQSIVWASRLLGSPLPERVAGIDLMHRLLRLAERRSYRVYVLGARESVLDVAVRRMQQAYPGLIVCGSHHGYFSNADSPRIARRIASCSPDMLFVALPSPLKEFWISEFGESAGATLQVGVGGSIDVLAGLTRRAPLAVQRAGLEWLWRVGQEPRRLAGRYARTNGQFVALLLLELARRRVGSGGLGR